MHKKLLLLILYTGLVIGQIDERPFSENKNNDNWKKYIIFGVCLGCAVLGKILFKLYKNSNKPIKPDWSRDKSISAAPALSPDQDSSPDKSVKKPTFVKVHNNLDEDNATPFVISPQVTYGSLLSLSAQAKKRRKAHERKTSIAIIPINTRNLSGDEPAPESPPLTPLFTTPPDNRVTSPSSGL